MRPRMEKGLERSRKRLEAYFAMTPEQKTAYLDGRRRAGDTAGTARGAGRQTQRGNAKSQGDNPQQNAK